MTKLLESFLAQSPACFWIVKGSPAESCAAVEFTHIWGQATSLFDRGPELLTGHTVEQVLPAAAAQLWAARFARVFNGETLALRERRGEGVWFITLFPIVTGDANLYAGGIAREVSRWGSAELQLRHTVLGALKAQDFERTMMARFLHDNIGQNLTALGLQLDLVRMDLEGVSPEVSEKVGEVQRSLSEIMEAVREYSYELDPATVERAGLRVALDRLAARTRTRYTGALRINVDPSVKLEPQLARAMFQIAQEAIENAIQHAACSGIDVSVKTGRRGLALEVRDNGRGFDPDDVLGGNRGLGLLSMEYYAAQAGLELSVAGTPGVGTTVRASQG